MPVLEDTVDFKVATLNDLLDADVRTGVPVAADDKYKRWAFLSTGLAGMLLVALIVALVTGGGEDGGSTASSKVVDAPQGTQPQDVLSVATVPTGVEPGAKVAVTDVNGQVVTGGVVTQIKEAKGFGGRPSYTVVVAVPNEDLQAFVAAKTAGKLGVIPGELPKATTTTTAPPSTTPTPIEPAPAPAPS